MCLLWVIGALVLLLLWSKREGMETKEDPTCDSCIAGGQFWNPLDKTCNAAMKEGYFKNKAQCQPSMSSMPSMPSMMAK